MRPTGNSARGTPPPAPIVPGTVARNASWTLLARDCGTNLVEFGLVSILFLTMLFGIVDFGRALYAYHFVSHAAREAARWAAVNGSTCGNDAVMGTSDTGSCTAPITGGSGSYSLCTTGCTYANQSDVQNYVKMIAPPGINASSSGCGGSGCLSTTATWQDPAWTTSDPCTSPPEGPGCTVRVRVHYTFNFLIPIVRNGSLNMSSTSETVIAH
jgi:Flp pilus assembly protein TadG